MADKTTKILEVVVDNNKAITAISEYNRLIDEQKAKQAELSQQFKKNEITEADYYKAMANSKEVVKTYKREVAELSKEMQNNIKIGREKEGALRALRAELSNMNKAYDSLSEAERNSEFGQNMQKTIDTLTSKIKILEHNTGRDYRNVGNYISGVVGKLGEVASGSGSAKAGVAGLTMGFKALSSTGIGMVLTVVAKVLDAVIKNLKSSEENANRMAIALAPLKAGGTALTKVFQWLGGALATAAEWLGKMADRLGLVSDKMKEQQGIVKEDIEIQKEQRRVQMENADLELKVSQLKAKASEKDKYTAKERKAFLEESIALERKIADNNVNLARREYDIAKRKSELAGNSKEENDALADSYVNLQNAERDYFNKVKELNAQRVEAINAMKAEAKTAEDLKDVTTELVELELEKVAKSLAESDEAYNKHLERQKEITEARLKVVEEGTLAEYLLQQDLLQQQADLDIARLEQEGNADELILLRRQQFHKDMQDLENQYNADMQTMLDEMLTAQLDTFVADNEKERTQLDAKKKAYEDTYSAVGNSVQALANLLAQSGEENRKLTQMSKILALAQIAIESGVAIAKSISAAMGSKSIPEAIANIAMAATAITTGITSAIASVKSAKFATGGYVSGPGTGTSDSINARLSNGESVINARSTAMFGPLLSSLNQAGGGIAFNPAKGASKDGYAFLASAVASGMQAAKLEVAVSEIQRVETRVAHIKERSVI